MQQLARSWDIAKASWKVLADERSLLVVSIVGHAVAAAAFVTVFFAGLALASAIGVTAEATGWVVLALAVLAAGAVAMIAQAAVLAGAYQRMEGKDPTVGSAIGALRGRVGRVLTWAVFTTGASRLLQSQQDGTRPGRVAGSGGRFAFRVVSFFVLPVLVLEDGEDAKASLQRSWQLLKGTWGENVSLNFGLKLLGGVVLAPAGLVLAGAAWAGMIPLPLVALAGLVAYVMMALAAFAALSAVIKATLYRLAIGASVDDRFDRRHLDAAVGG